MENQIVCPHCKKIHTDQSIIKEAAAGAGLNTQSLVCDCGERITYWQITAQLRNQKTVGWKLQNWFRTLTNRPA